MRSLSCDPLSIQKRAYPLSAREYHLGMEAALWDACDEIAAIHNLTTTELLMTLYDRLPSQTTYGKSLALMQRTIPVFLVAYFRRRANLGGVDLDLVCNDVMPEETSSVW